MLKVSIQTIAYRKKEILRDVSFEAFPGTFSTVIGRNGCGKSTLLSVFAGILPFTGSVLFDGREVGEMTERERARTVSFMLQMPKAPHVTVEELAAFGRYPWRKQGEKLSSEDRDIIENAIRNAELEKLRNCYADRISGGEQRRAYLAMQLAQNTPVMLLDESTAFMDADHELRFLHLLRELCVREKKILISVMHSMDHAVRFSDRILLPDGGRLVFDGSPEQLTKSGKITQIFGLRRYTAEDENGVLRDFFG